MEMAALWVSVLALCGDGDRPAPPPSDQAAELQREIRELFKDDYARKEPEHRQALAARLLDLGLRGPAEGGVRFVLLGESRDVALSVGDYPTAMRAIDGIGSAYALEVGDLKLKVINDAVRQARTAEALLALCDPIREAIDRAVRQDDFKSAVALSTKGEAVAKAAKDAPLMAFFRDRNRDVKALQRDFRAVEQARAALERDAEDPAANLTVGRYLALGKNEWERGIPRLLKGSDAELRGMAERDEAGAEDAAGGAALGDGWWALAEKERDAAWKAGLERRAVHWYGRALPELTGFDRLRAEQRLEEHLKESFLSIRCDTAASMEPYPQGTRYGEFPVQPGSDPLGPFRGEPVYFNQRTGRTVVYEVRSGKPLRRLTWRGAAMSGMTIEILEVSGTLVHRAGPFNGGNVWGDHAVDFPPRRQFAIRVTNGAGAWYLIDSMSLR